MSERWQSELRHLRTVDIPQSLHERIEAGPTVDRERPRRSRIAAGVVAFAVFAAGGGFAWLALRPSDEGRTAPVGDPSARVVVTVVESGSPDHYPSGTLTIGGVTVDGGIGPFGWCDGESCLTTDIEIPEFAPGDFIAIPVGAELVVESDAKTLKVSVGEPAYPFDNGDPIPLDGGTGALTGELGRHGLVVEAHWEDGEFRMDAPLYFPVELVEPPVPAPTPTSTEVPVPTPSPTTAIAPGAWWDVPSELAPVGVVCGATSVDGAFGRVGVRAWVFEPAPEGGCDEPNENFQYIGIEAPNGELVMHSDELRECLDADPCWAFSAPDLDHDGISEIAVGAYHMETQDLVAFGLYRLERCPTTETCAWRLVRFEIAAPGDPHEGFPPGPATFLWGGVADTVGMQGITCRPLDGRSAIVSWFTGTYDQWMLIDGVFLELVAADDLPPEAEDLSTLCGSPTFDVPA